MLALVDIPRSTSTISGERKTLDDLQLVLLTFKSRVILRQRYPRTLKIVLIQH
jgi:hypothetical protein